MRCFLGIEGSVREMQEKGLLFQKRKEDFEEEEEEEKAKSKVVDLN